MRVVYYPEGDILSAELGTRPCRIWRVVLEGRDVLKIGLIKRIRNGNDTFVWRDNWLPRTERLWPYASISDAQPVRVSELITVGKEWDTVLLQQHFLLMDIDVIKEIPLGMGSHDDF